MKISIITATYNSSSFINDCILSVENQTYKNIEHIIIDGLSQDDTLDKISELKSNCIVYSEKDKGIYDALNKGILKANGDIIGFLHSDDIFENKSTITNIVKQFEKFNVDGVYGDLVYVKKENPNKHIRYWISQDFKPSLLKRGWMPAHPTLFLRKEVYEKYGPFNLDFKISGDYNFILTIFKNQDLHFNYLHEIICKMRVGGVSNRSLKNIITKTSEDYKALKQNGILNPTYALIIKNFSKIIQFLR